MLELPFHSVRVDCSSWINGYDITDRLDLPGLDVHLHFNKIHRAGLEGSLFALRQGRMSNDRGNIREILCFGCSREDHISKRKSLLWRFCNVDPSVLGLQRLRLDFQLWSRKLENLAFGLCSCSHG